MYSNYLKIALRNLWSHKGYAGINIFGLSLGIACCFLIMLFVKNELSFDRFHTNADRLHRAWVLEDYGEGQRFFSTITPIPLGPTMEATFPEVEAVTRIYAFSNQVRQHTSVMSETLHLVDANFFETFDFEITTGNAKSPLDALDAVVLTEALAEQYFGDKNPIGQTLSIRIGPDTFEDFTVSAVSANPPPNSSIQYGILIRFERGDGQQWPTRSLQAWMSIWGETYVLLQPGTDELAFEAKLPTMVNQVLGGRVNPGEYTVGLQAMTDIHLNTSMPQGIAPVSNPWYAYVLGVIAVFVLIIACINFTMLSIGRSTQRATEVGIRKVVGANRNQLMYQYWGEAFLLTLIALVIGLLSAALILPVFNDLTGQALVFEVGGPTVLMAGALLVVVALLSGIYPALILSSFRPATVLKGRLAVGNRSGSMRRSLVIVQFALSIFWWQAPW